MYKLIYFVPDTHVAITKSSIFATGGGQLGEYSECCWTTLGTGQFRPSTAAHPTLGTKGELTQVSEYRVEILVAKDNIREAIAALKQAHPYEVPAFEVIALVEGLD